MSVKIKISYTNEEEFDRIKKQLFPLIRRWKKPNSRDGMYKNSCTESGCKCVVLDELSVGNTTEEHLQIRE